METEIANRGKSQPLSLAFGEFGRVKTGHHEIKTGQNHLFEHPNWSRIKFARKDFQPFFDPQITFVTLP